jgi:elongation factor G
MSKYSTEDIRNIVLVGHGNSGKTTLTEALLCHAGVIDKEGTIARGSTVSDFDTQEHHHQHSLNSTIVSLDYHGGHINLIDTPGYPDFLGRAVAVLPAVETAAVVINAQYGIEVVTSKMMGIAKDLKLDRLIIINKIDAESVDLKGVLEQVQEAFGPECLPINLPANNGADVIDCFFQPSDGPTDFSSVEEAHTNIIDQVVELDEELMELYLEQGEEISLEQLHDPFEKALREDHLVPVCFVSATTGAGVDQLLEIFAKLMPNPGEGNPPEFLRGEGDNASVVTLNPDPKKHALAHVFRVMIDPFIGKLAIFRIHQGVIKRDSQLFIDDGRKPFKASHLFKLLGKDHSEISKGIAGDICAVSKVEELKYGSVIHDSHEEDNIHAQPIPLPAPMYGLAITVKTRGDEQKISDALRKLVAEDQSFIVEHNTSLNETVIRGLGDLHLRIILDKLKNQHHVDVETRPPRIAYKETITLASEGHYRHKKQTGGAGQFGEVYLRVEPLQRGEGFEFVDEVVGGVIPRQYIPAVEKGIRQALAEGVIAGYELQDIRVRVYDGKYHSVDSKEVAFISAGKKAFIGAVKKANPVILEPVVEISITAPSDSIGDITADLSSKRGRISDTRVGSTGMTVVSGLVPLSELISYQSQIKSITGGNGSYSISFSHFDPVPDKTQHELQKAFSPKNDD